MDVLDVPAPAPPSAPTREKTLAEQYDLAVGWCAAAVTGMVLISIIPDDFGAWRMLVPLLVMVGFLLFGVSRQSYNTPRLADSMYFMGFLWTLWALIDVLVFNDQLSAEKVYKAFGYALIATGSGMFIRLALLQFYRTVDDQEQQAVDRLDEYVDKLLAEMINTQHSLAQLRIDAAAKLNDWHTDFAEASKKPVATVTGAAQAIHAESLKLSSAVGSVSDSIQPIPQTLKNVEGTLATFSKNLSAIELVPQEFEKRLQQAVLALERALAPLGESTTRLLGDMSKAVADLTAAILKMPEDAAIKAGAVQLATALHGLAGQCANLSSTARAADESLDGLGGAASGAAGGLGDAQKQIMQMIAQVHAALNQLSREAAQSAADVQATRKGLREVVDFVNSQFSGR